MHSVSWAAGWAVRWALARPRARAVSAGSGARSARVCNCNLQARAHVPAHASNRMHVLPALSTRLQGNHAHGRLPRRPVWLLAEAASGSQHGVSWPLRCAVLGRAALCCHMMHLCSEPSACAGSSCHSCAAAAHPGAPPAAGPLGHAPPLPCPPPPRSVWWIVTAATPGVLPPPMSFKAELVLPVSR